jgi:hypothetical protein
MKTYAEYLDALYRQQQHEATRELNTAWDKRWNGRAADRRAINSPWPAKQEVQHA